MTENSGEHFSFEDAKKTVLEGLAPMGEEYLSHLKNGFEHGWIDVYENQGKRSGAYSWGAYGTHPYVLLNYQGTLNDVFTLAHEMGHAFAEKGQRSEDKSISDQLFSGAVPYNAVSTDHVCGI